MTAGRASPPPPVEPLYYLEKETTLDDAAVYLKLTSIFRRELRNPALVIAPAMTRDDVPGWDSGTTVTIIMALEEEFDVEFEPGQLMGIRTVDDLAQLIRQYG